MGEIFKDIISQMRIEEILTHGYRVSRSRSLFNAYNAWLISPVCGSLSLGQKCIHKGNHIQYRKPCFSPFCITDTRPERKVVMRWDFCTNLFPSQCRLQPDERSLPIITAIKYCVGNKQVQWYQHPKQVQQDHEKEQIKQTKYPVKQLSHIPSYPVKQAMK